MDRAQTPDFYWNDSPTRPSPRAPGHEHRPPPPHAAGQGYQYDDVSGGGMLGEDLNFSRA
jgi:hypothetical protein